MEYDPRLTFKIIIIGESGIGKASLLKRFVENKYAKQHYATIGINFKTKSLYINNQNIKIKIWDTAGQERFNYISTQFYMNADGLVFIFDLTNRSTYNKLRNWMEQIFSNIKQEEMGFVLFGTKCDMESREVTQEMGKKLAEEFKVSYFETSALTGQGIKEGFEYLIEDIMKKRGLWKEIKEEGLVTLNINKKKKNKRIIKCQ